MEKRIDTWYSGNLDKDMEIVSYGQSGIALLMFPTAAADYLEYERFLVIDAVSGFIEAGKIQVYSINSINGDSWLNSKVHPKFKGLRQEQYNAYICNEVVPYIKLNSSEDCSILTVGASLGAFHAANQLFRRPDLFDGMIAMSGVYDIRKYYDSHGYHDENIYFNNPMEYLPNLKDESFLPLLKEKEHIHVLTGLGPYESPDASRSLAAILRARNIPHDLDVWGYDMSHDWPTWRAMLEFCIGAKL